MNPTKVLVAGDWHGNFAWALEMVRQAKSLLADEIDKVILQVGDFGIWPSQTSDSFLFDLNKALDVADITLMFIAGNHEWHPELLRLQSINEHTSGTPFGAVKIRSKIFWLPNGTNWTWHGKHWLGVGGAVSPDKSMRTEGHDWWPEEEITSAQSVALARIYGNQNISVMLTHDRPINAFIQLDPWPKEWDLPDKVRSEVHQAKLQYIVDAVQPELLIHGHYHMAKFNEVTEEDYVYTCIALHRDGNIDNAILVDTQDLTWQPLKNLSHV